LLIDGDVRPDDHRYRWIDRIFRTVRRPYEGLLDRDTTVVADGRKEFGYGFNGFLLNLDT
jgi:hypothetical protein